MPFHNDAQRDRVRPPEDSSGRVTPDQLKDGEAAVMQYYGQIRLWYNPNSNQWFSRITEGNGAPELITRLYYTPPRRIRGVSVMDTDSTGVLVEFDMPLATRALERVIFGIDRPFWVTRVHLPFTGAENVGTAARINLYY